MKTPNRDLLVLLKNEYASQQAIDHEVECLNHILMRVESTEQFCRAHELVNRFRITTRPSRLLRAYRKGELRPFHFLLNKN